jgi:hypothetical protein
MVEATMPTEIEVLVNHIRRTLGDLNRGLPKDDYHYASLPFCIIDAVYSIGARYESTYRTVCDFSAKYNWTKERGEGPEHYISEFMAILRSYENDWEKLANQIFRNRQRTSTRSGILKAEAVYRFAGVLLDGGIDAIADILACDQQRLRALREPVLLIAGQSSGKSFSYFLMLAGRTDVVKPDRMLMRFVSDALGERNLDFGAAEQLVISACGVLQSEFPSLVPSVLDYHIWEYQRGIASNISPPVHCRG